jgi:hypothetical protein
MLGFYFPGAVMEQVEDVADEIGSIPPAPTPA